MTNLKIQNIQITKTTLPLKTAVEFKRLVNDYLSIIDQDSQTILGKSKGNVQVEMSIKRQTLDAKLQEIGKLTDVKLRERKMTELQPQIDELEKQAGEIESKLYSDVEYRTQLLESTRLFENSSNKLMLDNQEKYLQKEIEILKVILPKIADMPEDFDFDNCTLKEPSTIIGAVLQDPENDCNAFFTKWSRVKNPQTAQ